MTLEEIVDLFERLPSGGIFTDDNRYDPSFVKSAVHRTRAIAIFQMWQKTVRINPVWTQQYYPSFSADLQEDNCKVIFTCPPVVSLNELMDGFLYIGTIQGNCPYRKAVSRAALANQNLHRNMRPTSNVVEVLYSDGFLECYGNTDLKQLRVDGIFADPTEIPTFNPAIDEYPASLDLIEMMKTIAFQTEQKIISSSALDESPDKEEIGSSVIKK